MQLFEEIRVYLEGLASTETRLAVSVILGIAAIVIAYLVLPRLLQRGVGSIDQKLDSADEDSYLTTIDEAVPWSFPTGIVTRALQAIINRTRRGSLRIRTDVGIDYETDIDTAEELAISAMEEVKRVAPAPKPQVIPKSLDDSAITLELRYWINNPSAHKKWQTKQAVVRRVKEMYDENGIGIPFPQRTISSREGSERVDAVETVRDGTVDSKAGE